MAIDLLKPNPPQPIYCHDLESLFHVMVWHAHRYQDGKLVDDPPFEDWARGTFDVAFKSKTSFILSGNIDPTPQHKPLYDVLFDSQRALARGIVQTRAQRETSPDGSRRIVLPTEEEMLTLCGNFSFEIVETLFKECDPMRVVVSK
ncbi:hypothetical protein EUX98_g5706 [Antrodiella citrinella]|uniref:Fungal-type protein kinase domain-containing protein n=1 Tax=Antrodiella citrinella TaxID=2447956 RepID=A0A4S4MYK9_9APHY|nr:hypothetical protein EUX98_g5706 [Antrodiella citrinella]